MIILRTFSKKKEKKEKDKKGKILAGLNAGALTANTALALKFDKSTTKNSEESKKLAKKIIEDAEKEGVFVTEADRPIKSYAGFTHDKKSGKNKMIMNVSKENASTAAHEYGHLNNFAKKEGTKKIGQLSHKLYKPTQLVLSNPITAIGSGAALAARDVNKEKKDGKERKGGKAALINLGVATPVLVAEAAASRNGIKTLKKAGASKELLKKSKKELGQAWGTYAAAKVGNAALSESSYHLTKKGLKKKDKEENSKKEKQRKKK